MLLGVKHKVAEMWTQLWASVAVLGVVVRMLDHTRCDLTVSYLSHWFIFKPKFVRMSGHKTSGKMNKFFQSAIPSPLRDSSKFTACKNAVYWKECLSPGYFKRLDNRRSKNCWHNPLLGLFPIIIQTGHRRAKSQICGIWTLGSNCYQASTCTIMWILIGRVSP